MAVWPPLPDLERYLPPYLWQKLQEDPRRGVLLNALDRLRSVLYLISTYLPRHLVQETLQAPRAGRARGGLLRGTLLFSDVAGFTALSERLSVDDSRRGRLAAALGEPAAEEGYAGLFTALADVGPRGIEELTENLNRYFDRMLEILAWSGGILLKFAGDALLAYFPELEDGAQARWAVRAGLRMMAALADFSAIPTPRGPVALRMKVGIATGAFLSASVGSAQRMEYVVLGATVARTMEAEGAAEAGLVVVDEATAVSLDPARCAERAPGFYAVRPPAEEELGSFEISAAGAGAGRRGGGASWIADADEIAADIGAALRQIEALTPFLPAELVERIVASAEQRRLESDFRSTVVIFGNFTGLEELLAAGLDPAQVTALLNDTFNAIQEPIVRYGGVVTRIDPYKQGSKVLMLFGAPVAHEDDPQRAARAALAMLEGVAAVNRRWRPALAGQLPPGWSGPAVQLRLGMTQGMTYAGQSGSATRREYTVMGDDVNLAARLMSASQPGQVLLAEPVYPKVAEAFRTTALPPIQVKGKRQAVSIYQLDGPHEDRLARRLQGHGALVGRAAEMGRLRAALAAALAGRGGLLTIAGPAGVGKSRLVDALVAEALAGGARAWLGECAAYAAEAPYAPWISLMQAIVGIAAGDTLEARGRKAQQRLLRLGVEEAEVTGPLLELLGLPARPAPRGARRPAAPPPAQGRPSLFERVEKQVAGPAAGGLNLWQLTGERHAAAGQALWQRLEARVVAREQARLFAAVDRFLQHLAAEAPTLLLLENAQWLDAASRELLAYLVERLAERALLVVLLQRIGEDAAGEAPGPLAIGGSPVLLLEPLPRADTLAMAAQLLGALPPGADRAALAEAIHAQSGGNPLFVEEMVRLLLQSGVGQPGSPAAALPGAGTLRELVLGRLDRRPPAERDVARAASVVGDEFLARDLPPLLEGEALGLPLAECLAGLSEAQLTQLLAAGGDPHYAFHHGLIREMVYSSLSFGRRRALHGRAAAALEARAARDPAAAGEGLAAYAELLAYHYARASEPVAAAFYLILSGHKARQRYAYAQASGAYGRAAASLDTVPPEAVGEEVRVLRAQAHEGLGDMALLAGDYAGAAAAYGTARTVLLGESVVEYDWPRLLLKQALVLPTRGQEAEALACAGQSWAELEAGSVAAPEQLLAAAAVLAWLLWRGGDAAAGEWLERAARLVGEGGGRWHVGVAALLADLRGEWAAAQEGYLEADRPAGAALVLCRRGDAYLAQGEVVAALALYEQAAALWQQENDAVGLALARYRQAEAHGRQGDAAAAGRLLREALGLLADAAADPSDAQVVRAAEALLSAGQSQGWPGWRWQRYDDALRVTILFRP